MLTLFASYCRNQQIMRQIIRKPFNQFCLSDSDIPKHIKTLIELREKKIQCENPLEEKKIDEQILTYNNDLNSYLKKFMVHQRDPYYLFRKQLIKLAYQSYFFNQNWSKIYIESAMCGDYENHYKDELMKSVFLAELYGIILKMNNHGKEEEFAAKSLSHWQNIVENHCQFYKSWKQSKSFDIDAFTKNMEVVYYDQYLECYVAILRELYQCGSFLKQKTYFEEAQTKIEEATMIILYLIIKNLQKINSYISQIKTLILVKNLKYGKELLEKIIKKNIANQEQILHLQILQFKLDSDLNQQKFQEIKSMYKNIEQKIDNIDKQLAMCQYIFFRYQQRVKKNKMIEQMIEQIDSIYMEFYLDKLERFLFYPCFNDLQELSYKCINWLVERKYTKHCFWDYLIFSSLLAVYRENNVELLQIQLHSIQNKLLPLIERPQDKIVQFFQLIIQLEMKSGINQVDQDLLQKIEQIEFEQPLIKYQQQLALEKIYKTYNLKQDQISKNN